MSRLHSLSTRLVIAMLLPLSLLLLLATWIETRTASRSMLDTGETAAMNLATTVKEELQGVLRSTKAGVHALSIPLARLPSLDEDTVVSVLGEFLEQAPLVYGTTLSFEPDATGDDRLAPYLHRSGDGLAATSLADKNYRYWEQPWFTRPLEAGRPVWSQPYFDEGGGGVRMVTYSVPVDIGGRRAVLTADLELGFLNEIANSNLLGRPGNVLVFDRQGRLVAHPRESWVLERNLADLGRDQALAGLAAVPTDVAAERERWLRPVDGMHEGLVGGNAERPGRLFVLPLKEAGWGVGVYFSDDDFLADIREATRFRLLFALALLVLLAATLALVSLRSLRPLGELTDRTGDIARGNFHGDTPGRKRQDEIGRLARAFHRMQEQLKRYVEDLTQAAAARERMDAELTTARLLQQSLLPASDPGPEVVGADLAATLRSAQAVGGDLFNYLRLDDGRLFFVIGDVSDEGVPAALFMTRANALIKAAAVTGVDPEDVLEAVNRALSEENELCMFVTLLVGLLELDTGRLQLASAGHDVPLHVSAGGAVARMALEKGPPVGLDESAAFPAREWRLEPGDALVAFTDGVAEARDPQGEPFGIEGLERSLADGAGLGARALLTRVHEALEAFSEGAETADDQTLLVVRRLPR